MVHTSYHSDDEKFRAKANDHYMHIDLGDDIAPPFSLAMPITKARELCDVIMQALEDKERRDERERRLTEGYAEAGQDG